MATCAQWRMIGAILCVLWLVGCGSKPEPVVEEPVEVVERVPEPPFPEPDPIELAEFESVTLKPATKPPCRSWSNAMGTKEKFKSRPDRCPRA